MSMGGRVCAVCNHVDGRILQELSQMYRTLQFWEKAHMWRGFDARDEMIVRCTMHFFVVHFLHFKWNQIKARGERLIAPTWKQLAAFISPQIQSGKRQIRVLPFFWLNEVFPHQLREWNLDRNGLTCWGSKAIRSNVEEKGPEPSRCFGGFYWDFRGPKSVGVEDFWFDGLSRTGNTSIILLVYWVAWSILWNPFRGWDRLSKA